ncbi:hypothetical protein D9757_007394 [Collybiopsis confluens]|uniref:Uncharacterized protein n=1 Tax=Collybiopsis confluens TaxID=2823264 RepID=A0A8H5HIF0_9AGAR|nr:hypothetical protein D9757_007394 [Collybiopsis confluens]
MFKNQPISESDAIFARAYASAIKSSSATTSPFSSVPSPNYTDNPAYTGGSAGSYLQQLRSHIDWVKTSGNPSQVIIDRMNTARDATAANAN